MPACGALEDGKPSPCSGALRNSVGRNERHHLGLPENDFYLSSLAAQQNLQVSAYIRKHNNRAPAYPESAVQSNNSPIIGQALHIVRKAAVS